MRLDFLNIFLLFLKLVFIHALIPTNLLPLNDTEKDEIMAQCGHYARSADRITERIWNGNPATNGQFPYAAYVVIQYGQTHQTCGATLISWRHAVTAQHCFKTESTPHSIQLWAGGVCTGPGEGPCQTGPYMEKLDVHKVFFIPSEASEDDHAIIQLKEQVHKDLQQRVKFACLARQSELLPDPLTAFGWGAIAYSPTKEPPSAYLRYTTLTTASSMNCNPAAPILMCAVSPYPASPSGTSEGDSGGGAVDLEGRLQGISIQAGWAVHKQEGARYYSQFVRVSMLLDFYCQYLDLCMPPM